MWLILNYKEYLRLEYPGRTAMRVQDLATYANKLAKTLDPKADETQVDETLESLTETAQKLPVNVRRALVRSFGLYSISDSDMDKKLINLRLTNLKSK